MMNWVRTTNEYAQRLVLNSKLFKNRSTVVFGLIFLCLATQFIQLATAGVHGGQQESTQRATLAAPSVTVLAPSILSAAALSSSSIALQWQDNSTNETGFQIERCMGDACTDFAALAKVTRNITVFTDTNLKESTAYCYRVYALGKGKSTISAYSNIAEAITFAAAAPPIPTPTPTPIPTPTPTPTPIPTPSPTPTPIPTPSPIPTPTP